MSELAFDKEGNPFRFSRRTKKLRPRRWKSAGQRGTCAAVLDADGEPVLIDADAEYIEFRATVGNVPGFYRLDQCDEDGAPIEEAPPAYVSIASPRNAAPIGEVDPRDAIIRDLAQINADVVRTMTERFGNVMQAAADILRAADGAGLSRREPPRPSPPPPPPPTPDEDEEDDEDEDHRLPPSERVWAVVEPMLPALGAWLASMVAKRLASASPAATPAPAPAPAPASAPAPAPAEAAPEAGPAHGDVAAGPSAPEPAVAPAPAVSSAAAPSAPAPVAAPPPASSPAPGPMGGESRPSGGAGASSTPVPMASGSSRSDGAASSTTAITGAIPTGTAQSDGPRNAATLEPTPEQCAHLFAIRAQLSPREAAIVDTVIARMTPEMCAGWIAELSLLGVDEAVGVVRSMIPKRAPKPPAAKNGAEDDAPPGAQEAITGPPDGGSSP